MRNIEDMFLKRSIDYNKLIEYGFKKNKNIYCFRKNILNNEFEVEIELSDKNKIAKVLDLNGETEYVLVDVEDAQGEFVGNVRKEYDLILNDILEKCTAIDTFIFPQTQRIIDYIFQKYNDSLEFLWDDYDGAAIRNKTNNKWYLVYMIVQEKKVRLNESERTIEIIDLKYDKDKVSNIIDSIGIFPGYHMNKHSWISIVLDDSEDDKKIKTLIDNSYKLSGGIVK